MKSAVSFLLKDLKISTDEVILHFVSEDTISKLHKKFFNDPSVTDCITFPVDQADARQSYHVLGECFICPKTAISQAMRHDVTTKEELYRYVVHCLLHLIGYDDTNPKDRARMKRKERACLKKLFPSH